MSTEMLTEQKERTSQRSSAEPVPIEVADFRAATRKQAKRVRRLKINVAAWLVGSALITGLWVLNQWQANGAFEHFGSHEGNPGDWNPTLWALGVGTWGLVVAIMALRVHFERPPTVAEVGHELERLGGRAPDAKPWRVARTRLERIGRLKFHVAAWVLGVVVLAPIWALIEWQDNGGFERWSDNGQPGSWEPWILYVGGIWALVVALFALWVYLARTMKGAQIERAVERLRSGRRREVVP